MDRAEIERHDFPTGRRGYDPAAVDEHLRHVADEFERLRARPPAAPTLSGGASKEVRLILEAAERGASALLARAGEQASGHVERIRAAADGLLGRLGDLEAELDGLLQALRQSGERLARGLEDLQAEAAAAIGHVPLSGGEEDFAAAAPERGAEPVDAEPPASAPATGGGEGRVTADPAAQATGGEDRAIADPAAQATGGEDRAIADPAAQATGGEDRATAGPAARAATDGYDEAADTAPRPFAEPGSGGAFPPPSDAPPPPFAASAALGGDELPAADEVGARLIALNMALDGSPREETARYLADHFTLEDPEGLLDDVYSRAER